MLKIRQTHYTLTLGIIVVLLLSSKYISNTHQNTFNEITLFVGLLFLLTGMVIHRVANQKRDLTHTVYLAMTGLRGIMIIPAVLWALKSKRYPADELEGAAFWLLFNLFLMLALEVKSILRILRPD